MLFFLSKMSLAVVISLAILWGVGNKGMALADGIELNLTFEAQSDFPNGILFKLDAISAVPIEEVSVRMKIGQRKSGVYEYMDIVPSKEVSSELFWNTNTSSRYIPPGTPVEYKFEIFFSNGQLFETETKRLIFEDMRFEWDEVSEGNVVVYYHGPVKSRANEILDAITSTMILMEPVLGESQQDPIIVTMYNNVKEMLVALPPGSSTIRRELITEGQAFNDVGTLLVLGGGRLSTGTASHEVMHILVHRSAHSVLSDVPDWLHEGLAEYANVSPSFSYDIALDFAVHSGRVLPITSMPGKPGNPEDVIIYYGQASSLIAYMIEIQGPLKMKSLLAELKKGVKIDSAIKTIYGLSKIDLENKWRKYIGADPYVPPLTAQVLPTPLSRPTVTVLSLTPQSGSKQIGSLNKEIKESGIDKAEETTNGNVKQKNPDVLEGKSDSRSCNQVEGFEKTNNSVLLMLGFVLVISLRKRL